MDAATSPLMSPAPRSLSLDLFRAGAIFLVLLRHLRSCPAEASQALHAATKFLALGGWIGVDLFFVLSGFLVGGLLFKEFRATGTIRPARFLARRAFKILPLLWVALASLALLFHAFGAPLAFRGFAPDVFFYSDYAPGMLGVGWSLSVEEHFYLLLPPVLLILAAGGRKSGRPFQALPAVVLGTAIVTLFLRNLAFDSQESYSFFRQYTPTHLRLDALFTGVLLAYAWHYYRERFVATVQKHRLKLLLGGLLGLAPAFFLPVEGWYLIVVGMTVNCLSAAALLSVAVCWSPAHPMLLRPIALVGRQSYATYLIHYTIGKLAAAFVLDRGPDLSIWIAYAAAYAGSSLVLGAILTTVIEKPFLALRDRWMPPTPSPAAPVPVADEGMPAALCPATS